MKSPKVLESLLGMAPLQSKGDFEDDVGEEDVTKSLLLVQLRLLRFPSPRDVLLL